MFTKIKTWFSNDWKETKLLFRNLPAIPFAILCAALIVMNVLANKLIIETSWLSLDAGIIVSWVAFLAGDMLVKRFGPKASLKINIAALGVQFIGVVLLTIGGILPTPVEGCLVTQLFGWSLYLPWAFSVGTLAFLVAISVDVLISASVLVSVGIGVDSITSDSTTSGSVASSSSLQLPITTINTMKIPKPIRTFFHQGCRK